MLEIFKNGIEDTEDTEETTPDLPSAPATMRIEYLLESFEAGSLVNYNVFFNDAELAFSSGTFQWSGDNENYLSFSSNLSENARFDNLEIIGGDLSTIDYSNWSNQYPTTDLSDPEGDSDGDGLNNDAERLFGLNPTDSSANFPFTELPTSSGTFTYTRRNPVLTGADYLITTSTNLQDWAPANETTSSVLSLNANGVETVEITFPNSAQENNDKLFIRIETVN